MKTKRMMSAAIILGCTAIASAQGTKDKHATPQGTPPTVSKDELKKGLPFCHKATDIVGSKVKNTKGEDLGKVEELVIDPGSGSIEYAVISFGGFLGMGDKYFAVPFSLLRAPEVPEGDKWAHFTFDVDKSRLEKAPGFDKNNWPDVATPDWSKEVDVFYNTKRATEAASAVDANKDLRLVKASDLVGKKIENTSKDNLGDIKELVLDPRRSRVSYIVMKSGGFLGMGDKLFAIPWQAIKFDRKEKKDELVLNVSKERFEKAPEYKDKEWNRMSDPAWVEDVYVYYGARPYWTGSHPIEK